MLVLVLWAFYMFVFLTHDTGFQKTRGQNQSAKTQPNALQAFQVLAIWFDLF